MVPPRRALLACVLVGTFVLALSHLLSTLSALDSSVNLGYAVSAYAPFWTILETNQIQSPSFANVQPSLADLARPTEVAVLKPVGEAYRRAMVVPRMQEEDIRWMSENLPDLDVTIYVANDAKAPIHPPKNKGHEVIIYFSFIIDHYEQLPDIVLFMHAHRYTHHNSEILNFDAVQMIQRLSNDYVITQGYVNMRCTWSPGCPQWLQPETSREDISKQEEAVLSQSWHELFPYDPLPRTLAQACCAQFALSKQRIQAIPKSRYIFFRDWIMRTPLSDYISGRIWEYSWQYLFTGQGTFCPDEHLCLCNGFGICFRDRDKYHQYEELRYTRQVHEKELKDLREAEVTYQYRGDNGNSTKHLTGSIRDEHSGIRSQLNAIIMELSIQEKEAIEYGNNLRNKFQN